MRQVKEAVTRPLSLKDNETRHAHNTDFVGHHCTRDNDGHSGVGRWTQRYWRLWKCVPQLSAARRIPGAGDHRAGNAAAGL
jgi:hypothetical protein